jgi:DNA-binding response OmpR family regulator
VAPEATAPPGTECDEDWIRLPASDDDVRVRAVALAARAARHDPHPQVNGDGRISFRDRWVALSHTEEMIARALAENFGDVVSLTGGQGRAPMTSNALRVHVARLRKRIRPLGLVVRTVHGRGYVLERG